MVNFSGPPELMGRLVMAELTQAHPHSLKGRWRTQSPAWQVQADGRPAIAEEGTCYAK